MGLIGVCHAVGDKIWPPRGPVVLAHGHGPVSQHRHAPSDPPPGFVPPPLRSDRKQGLRQVLHAQARQGRPHREPHVGGPGLTGGPGGLKDQLGLLLGAVQQANLEESKEGREGAGTRKDTHTYTYK